MLGRNIGVAVLHQNEKIFPNKEMFYFLEPTQKENEFELYFTNQSKEVKEKSFTILVGTIYQYDTARVIMNLLNEKLEKIDGKA